VTLTRDVTLPPATPVGGGILDQASALPQGWEQGVQFATEACLAAGEHVFCHDSPTAKQFQGTLLSEWDAYGVEVSVVCSVLGGERATAEREARAFQALEAIDEFSVGYVLATGETQAGLDTQNPSLADASSGGTSATAVGALAIIEDALATNLKGLLGWVHVTPARLTELVDAGVLYRTDGPRWRTATGHVVVASPGYVGNIDDEIVATTQVYAERGAIELIRTYDRSDNRHMAVHEAAALAVFDPCFNVSVAITDSP
jgi:hypothetical protein